MMGILAREKNLPTVGDHVQKATFGNFLCQTTIKMTLQSESHPHRTLAKSLFPTNLFTHDNLGMEDVTTQP